MTTPTPAPAPPQPPGPTTPGTDTPPIPGADPVETMRVLQVGYHQAVISLQADGRWLLTPTSSLGIQIEVLYYGTADAATAAGEALLRAANTLEQDFRAAWIACYATALGRGSAPDTPGGQA